jgi:hypothetical protein
MDDSVTVTILMAPVVALELYMLFDIISFMIELVQHPNQFPDRPGGGHPPTHTFIPNTNTGSSGGGGGACGPCGCC